MNEALWDENTVSMGRDETGINMSDDEPFPLIISEAVADRMAERRIGRQDVLETIRQAETTGAKFINAGTGRSLAFLRPDRVTYWVEYSRSAGGFEVHSAYSHRMEMKRE